MLFWLPTGRTLWACGRVRIPFGSLFRPNGREKVTDTVWLVYIPEEEQIRRAMARSGMTREEVKDRIRKQLSLEEKRKQAQVVLDNRGTLEDLYRQVDRELDRLSL